MLNKLHAWGFCPEIRSSRRSQRSLSKRLTALPAHRRHAQVAGAARRAARAGESLTGDARASPG